ncbi:stage V sporulation protein M [Actinosynnema sp. NPDC059335]|uniref:stage V sporulation protein M n=1 Tax=Actinosynnema sp. NPDC059335 TaxID=3346804 RepID=UPI00366F33F2
MGGALPDHRWRDGPADAVDVIRLPKVVGGVVRGVLFLFRATRTTQSAERVEHGLRRRGRAALVHGVVAAGLAAGAQQARRPARTGRRRVLRVGRRERAELRRADVRRAGRQRHAGSG